MGTKIFTKTNLILTITALTQISHFSIAGTHSESAKRADFNGNKEDALYYYYKSVKDDDLENSNESILKVVDLLVVQGDTTRAISRLEDYLKKRDSLDYSARVKIIEMLMKERFYDDALRHIAVVEKLRGYDVKTEIYKANILYNQEKYAEALAAVDRDFGSEAIPLELHATKASVLNALKRYDEAATLSKKVLAVDAKNPLANLTLAESEVGKNNNQSAISIMAKFGQNLRANSDWEVRAARLFQKVKDFRAARDFYGHAYKMEPERSDLVIEMARCSIDMNDWNQAVLELETAVNKSPDHDRLVFWLGKTYILMKQYDKAGQLLRGYIAKFPDRTWAAISYSKVMRISGDMETAMNVLKENQSLKPEDTDVVVEIAMVQSEQGLTKDAIEALTNYQVKYPENDKVKIALGDLLNKIGAREDARHYYSMVSSQNKELASVVSEKIKGLSDAGRMPASIKEVETIKEKALR